MNGPLDRQAGKTYPHHCEINTRHCDTDSFRHLNNVSTFRYYQDGQARFMLDCLPELASQPGWSLRTESCDVSYDGQVYWPDSLDVASGVEQVGEHWIQIAQALFQRGQYVGQCDAIVVLVDDQGRPLAFSPSQRTQLESCRLRCLAT